MSTFSEAVLTIMEERGITVAQIARQSGYSWPYIYDLLKGKRRWNEDTMNKVSNVVGLVIAFIPSHELEQMKNRFTF